MSFVTNSIEYSSRYEDASEMAQMEAFIAELQQRGLTALVTRLFYDSKANICSIGSDEPTNPMLWRIAEKHILQFELGGTIGHGDNLFDYEFEIEKIEGDINASSEITPEDSRLRRIERGRAGEEALANWFSKYGLSHLSICQNTKTFARLFTGAIKRPDFFLLFDSLGLIAVDAKNIIPYKGQYFTLPLEEEVRRAVAFERIFRMPLWYAFYTSECWYWISALKAVEVGKQLQNSLTGQIFLSIDKHEFICIVTGSDLGKLYGQRMPGYGNLADLTV